MYEYPCEYCRGTVKPRAVEQGSFKHRNGFIIPEDVTIGVCDRCGTATTVRRFSARFMMLRQASVAPSGPPWFRSHTLRPPNFAIPPGRPFSNLH